MKYRILLFFLCGYLVVTSCENDESKVRQMLNKRVGVEEADSVTINYTTGGKIKAVLTSPLMLRVQDTVSLIEFPQSLQVIFYNEGGVAESKLSALYGKYREYRDEVFLKDSVRVINFLKGDTLMTEELYWDRSRTGREFYTNKPLRIRTKTQILDGIGMEASQDFKNYHILESTGILDLPASALPQ